MQWGSSNFVLGDAVNRDVGVSALAEFDHCDVVGKSAVAVCVGLRVGLSTGCLRDQAWGDGCSVAHSVVVWLRVLRIA